jgi:aminoglycoside phosphotransferase (APT) family kinase protein
MPGQEQDFPKMPTGTKEVEPRHRLDIERLEGYLRRELEGFRGPLEVRQFRGGQSNPTYQLSDPGGRWVLRRRPPGKLLRSAHAVDREFRVLTGLNQVEFPVPRARFLCEDESVVGTTFYVMDFVEGRVFWDPMLPEMRPEERRGIYDSMNRILAQLHAVDYQAIGLGDYGRPGNYFARQISRWSKQYHASQTEAVPEMDRLIEWLPDHIPEEDSASIVHGDYGLNNMLVHPTEPNVVAILDWELSTIGHPLADLTYHLSHRRYQGSAFVGLSDQELRKAGIPTESEYVEAYCRRTGRDGIPDLDFYLAYNLFRAAAILQGIAGRIRDGTAAGENAPEVAKLVRPLAETAMSFASKLGA